jgi:hypothetical protein
VLEKQDVLIFIKKEFGAQGWFEFVIFLGRKGHENVEAGFSFMRYFFLCANTKRQHGCGSSAP